MAFRRIGQIASISSLLALAYACTSTSSSSNKVEPCNPGEAVSCRTPEGCSGEKVCKPDGQGYEACACGMSGAGGDGGGGSGGTAGSNGSGGSNGGGGSKGSGGSAGSNAGGSAGDTGESGSGGGAGETNGPCDLSAPFGTPEWIDTIGTTDTEQVDAALSADQLTLYFGGTGVGGWDLFTASRSDPSGLFGDVMPLSDLSTPSADGSPTVTAAEDTIYFAAETAGWQVYSATRMSTAEPFGLAQLVVTVNSGAADYNPFVLPDGSALYLTSNRLVGQNSKIFRAVRDSGGFAEPVPVQGLGGEASVTDTKAVVTPDELTIYFASDRPDANAAGANDIWTASRSSNTEPFELVRLVTELNSPALDEPSWISADGCTIYFQSARSNLRRVYVARKP